VAFFDRLFFSHAIVELLRIALVIYLFWGLRLLGRLLAKLLRVSIQDRLARSLVEIGLGFGAYSTAVRMLAQAGLATRISVLGMLLLPALLAFGRRRVDILDLGDSAPAGASRWMLALLALLPLPMALAPAVSYDALVYQLRVPEVTLQTGLWGIDPANSTTFFPAATGSLYLASLSVDPSGVAAQLIHYGFFLLTLVAMAALSRHLRGECDPWRGAVLFAAIPAAGIVAGWSWSDMPLCFSLLAAGLCLVSGEIAAALVLLGLAAAVKYSGLVLAIPLCVAAAVLAVRKRATGQFAFGCLGALVIAAPWYAANALSTGNPIYPLLPSVFGGPSSTARNLLQWHSTGAGDRSPLWTYFVRPATLDGDLGGIGMLALSVVALLYALRVQRLRLAALVLLFCAALLSLFSPAERLLLPILAGSCLLSGLALEGWSDKRVRLLAVLVAAFFTLRGAALIAGHNAFFFNPMACAAGVETEEAYRRRNFPPAALFERGDQLLPPHARVLSYGEPKLFGFPRRTVASSAVDPPAVLPYLSGAAGAEQVVSRLRAGGITHLLISVENRERAGPSHGRSESSRLTPRQAALLRETLARCRVLDREGSLLLVEVPNLYSGGAAREHLQGAVP